MNTVYIKLIFGFLLMSGVSFFVFNSDKNINKTLFLTIISVLFLYIFNENINKYSVMETFKQAPIDYKMGSYDNIKLKPDGCSDWRHSPACNKLYTETEIYTPHGTPLPLSPKFSKNGVTNGPTVDGTLNTPNDMFIFAYNKSSLDCCPSTYSTDRGCVCTTKQQRRFINSRGNNRNYNGDVSTTHIDA